MTTLPKRGLRIGLILVCLVFTSACPVLCASRADSAGKPRLAICDAWLFDTQDGRMLPHRTILVEGERIAAIGTTDKPIPIPKGTRRIIATGKYVIPGLIDGHAHVAHLTGTTHTTRDEILPLFLANGVTSIRGIGDEMVAQKLIARYAEAHPGLCPSVFMCSPLIDGDPPFHQDAGWAITDPAQVSAFVDDMVAWGVVTLKLYVKVSHDVFRKVIDEGHKRGLTVTAHLGSVTTEQAVEDGIDCFEHIWAAWSGAFPPDDLQSRQILNLDNPTCKTLIEHMAKHNVRICPTLAIFEPYLLRDLPQIQNNPDINCMPERVRKVWREWQKNSYPGTLSQRQREFDKYKELTGMLYRGGVTILAGTDTVEPLVVPGCSLHRELQLLVESGMPPSAALQAGTINVARVLHQEKNIGSIEVGKQADMVVLDADPLADIGNTRRISCIIHKGMVCNPKTVLKAVPKQ